jgi:hypothetical protein
MVLFFSFFVLITSSIIIIFASFCMTVYSRCIHRRRLSSLQFPCTRGLVLTTKGSLSQSVWGATVCEVAALTLVSRMRQCDVRLRWYARKDNGLAGLVSRMRQCEVRLRWYARKDNGLAGISGLRFLMGTKHCNSSQQCHATVTPGEGAPAAEGKNGHCAGVAGSRKKRKEKIVYSR